MRKESNFNKRKKKVMTVMYTYKNIFLNGTS